MSDTNPIIDDLTTTIAKIEDLRNDIEDSEEQIVELMIEWFHKNYEDPAEMMPCDGGSYVWIVPERDADEELSEMFENVVSRPLIEKAVEILLTESWSWVKSSDWDDFGK